MEGTVRGFNVLVRQQKVLHGPICRQLIDTIKYTSTQLITVQLLSHHIVTDHDKISTVYKQTGAQLGYILTQYQEETFGVALLIV